MKRLVLFIVGCFLLLPGVVFAASTVTVTNTVHCDSFMGKDSRCIRKVTWAWACDGATTAEDTTATATLTGKVVGVRAKDPNNDIATAYTVKILDSAGHDILQGVGADVEFSATATVNSEFRVPVDDTSGGYIYLVNEAVYLSISSAGDGDNGTIELYVELP